MIQIIKRVLPKALLLFILLSFISFIIRQSLPYSWGSLQLNSKITFIEKNNLDPNVYVIGSSVSNRQFMPTYFDSLIGIPDLSTFNLAIDGTMPPHHFYLLENLIKADTSIEYIFMELDGFDHMPPRHFTTTFSKFYFNPKWFSWSIANLWLSPSIAIKQKTYLSYKYTRSFVENIFFIGMRRDVLKSLHEKNSFSYRVLNKYKDGHMFFNTLFTEKVAQQKIKSQEIKRTKNEFILANKKPKASLKSNIVYKHLLKKYQLLCEKNDIKLIYVINPRNCVLLSSEELVDIENSLPSGSVIDLASPKLFSELYNEELRYDADHLNAKGALIYTKLLSESFIAVM